MLKQSLALGLAAAVLVAWSGPGAGEARAQEAQLKAAFFIPPSGSLFRKAFDQFVEEVNSKGKGKVQIVSVVSREAIPPNQMSNAVRNGIVDIAGMPPSYMSNLVPGLEGLSSATKATPDMHKDGTIEYLQKILGERANARLLAQYGQSTPVWLFANEPFKSLEDIKGKSLRASPTHLAFFKAADARPVNAPRGEVYTNMERGVIVGYVNPASEVMPEGWHKVTKYRIAPSFYDSNVITIMNKASYEKLNAEQKAIIDAAAAKLEGEISAGIQKADEEAMKKLEAEGIQTVTMDKAAGEAFRKKAYDATWDEIVQKSPELGPELRKRLYPN